VTRPDISEVDKLPDNTTACVKTIAWPVVGSSWKWSLKMRIGWECRRRPFALRYNNRSTSSSVPTLLSRSGTRTFFSAVSLCRRTELVERAGHHWGGENDDWSRDNIRPAINHINPEPSNTCCWARRHRDARLSLKYRYRSTLQIPYTTDRLSVRNALLQSDQLSRCCLVNNAGQKKWHPFGIWVPSLFRCLIFAIFVYSRIIYCIKWRRCLSADVDKFCFYANKL